MERLRQTHSKDIESKDDEVEEIRQSCNKKVKFILDLNTLNTLYNLCCCPEREKHGDNKQLGSETIINLLPEWVKLLYLYSNVYILVFRI